MIRNRPTPKRDAQLALWPLTTQKPKPSLPISQPIIQNVPETPKLQPQVSNQIPKEQFLKLVQKAQESGLTKEQAFMKMKEAWYSVQDDLTPREQTIEKVAQRNQKVLDAITVNKWQENPVIRAGKWVLWAVRWWLQWLVSWVREWTPQMFADIKATVKDPNMTLPEKALGILYKEVLADFVAGDVVGGAFGGAMVGGVKWFTTPEEQQQAKQFFSNIIKPWSTADQVIQTYKALPQKEKKKFNYYAGGLFNLADLVPASLFASKTGRTIAKKWIDIATEWVGATNRVASELAQEAGKSTAKLARWAVETVVDPNDVAEWLLASYLKNPAMREKYIAKVWQTPERTILEEWIQGTLEEQAEQILKKGKESMNFARSEAKRIPEQIYSEEWAWITNKILEWVDETIPWIQAKLQPIREMNKRFTAGTASADDLIMAKTYLTRYQTIYDGFGRVKKTWDVFEKEALNGMYQKMKTDLEDLWKKYGIDFENINRTTMKFEGLRWLLTRAVSREKWKDIISLSDYILWGLAISADPVGWTIAMIGKKRWQSPKTASKVANLLYKKKWNVDSVRDGLGSVDSLPSRAEEVVVKKIPQKKKAKAIRIKKSDNLSNSNKKKTILPKKKKRAN